MIKLKKNQVVLLLRGGLGNQMFQFVFASIIAKKNKTTLSIDKNYFSEENQNKSDVQRPFELDVFNVSYNLYEEKLLTYFEIKFYSFLTKLKLIKNEEYTESSFEFSKKALQIKKPVYIKGYFQSYKYFDGNEGYIRSMFTFSNNKLAIINN